MRSGRRWLIYGTGALASALGRRARELGIGVLVRGRDQGRAAAVGAALGIESVTLSLDGHLDEQRLPDDVVGVVSAAGPYSRTAQPVLGFCLAHALSYVDLSNEYASHAIVWEAASVARERRVAAVSGAGFGTLAAEIIAAEALERFVDVEELTLVLPPRRRSGATAGVRGSSAHVLAARPAEVINGTIHHMGNTTVIGRIQLPDGVRTVVPLRNGDLEALARTVPGARIRVCAEVDLPAWAAVMAMPLLRRKARRTLSRDTPRPAPDVPRAIETSGGPASGESGGTLWLQARTAAGRNEFLGLEPTSGREFAVEAALDVVRAIDRYRQVGAFTPSQILQGEDLHRRVMRLRLVAPGS